MVGRNMAEKTRIFCIDLIWNNQNNVRRYESR